MEGTYSAETVPPWKRVQTPLSSAARYRTPVLLDAVMPVPSERAFAITVIASHKGLSQLSTAANCSKARRQ